MVQSDIQLTDGEGWIMVNPLAPKDIYKYVRKVTRLIRENSFN